MRRAAAIAALLIFFNTAIAHSSVPELQYASRHNQHVTDDMLHNIAVEKGVIPKDADESFLKRAIENKNTVAIWILLDHSTRLSLIDNLRELNKKDGVIISLPSEYYVSEMTGDIYNSIANGDVVVMELGNILRTIAVMEGDYGNNKDKVAFAKEYMGEDGFQMYKSMYPEKYEKLIKR